MRAVISLFFLFLFLNFLPPENLLSFIFFYCFVSLAFFFLFNIFTNRTKSCLSTIIIVVFLLLRQNRLDNLLNLILLGSITMTFYLYFRNR
ncbi:hypothetical protein MUP32_00775 [Candidatus Microgenomates bacterium]|nr:hypothetical protein [Candidatus Microgenomates bacterium]